MNKLLFIYLIFLNNLPILAEGILLHGRVTDGKGNIVEYAYIEALKDSNVLGYTLSDDKGLFKLELPIDREYSIHISHISYKPFYKKITPTKERVSFILEEYAEALSEVIIVGYTKAMRMNSDGNIVFNPNTLGNSITYDLPRLLQTLPGIQISSSGITQNGRLTAILVNGHRRNMNEKSIEAFLKTIPPDKIKEIIINPSSSAGDLASENGSINIIMKKEKELLSAEISGEMNMRRGGTYGNGNVFNTNSLLSH